MWVNVQTGLLEAAWNLKERNSHVKIFCSIRKEAYDEYQSEVKSNLASEICLLNYRKEELYKLVNKQSFYYENVKTVEGLTGIEDDVKFTHSGTGKEEFVFDYILRHTVAKPRDLIRIASTLKGRIIPKNDIEQKIIEFRNATNEAATEIAKTIFYEKANFMDCIKNEEVRNKFLSLLPKNILSQKTVKDICRKFNKVKNIMFCTREQCIKEKMEGGCKHPFCDLYNIGLFGYVKDDEFPQIQIFKMPDTKNISHIVGSYSYYIVHPSLYIIITELRLNSFGKKYIITPGITTGHGYEWGENESEISDLIDYILKESKNISVETEKQIMQEIKSKINAKKKIKELSKELKEKIIFLKRKNKSENRKMNMKKKKIFLSYCWEDKTIANRVDKSLKALGLNITRDERDMIYKADVKKFMTSLKKHDYVITIISDSYLKSKNCMTETGELLKMKDYKSKTLQIILLDANKIYDTEKKWEYINYWKEQMKNLESTLKNNLSAEYMQLIRDDIKHYNDIIKNLPKFIKFITSEKGMTQEELENSDYKKILSHINKRN